jgi:hypothetical protein
MLVVGTLEYDSCKSKDYKKGNGLRLFETIRDWEIAPQTLPTDDGDER